MKRNMLESSKVLTRERIIELRPREKGKLKQWPRFGASSPTMAVGSSNKDGWETEQDFQQVTSLGKWELDLMAGSSGRKSGKIQILGWGIKDLPWEISNKRNLFWEGLKITL